MWTSPQSSVTVVIMHKSDLYADLYGDWWWPRLGVAMLERKDISSLVSAW